MLKMIVACDLMGNIGSQGKIPWNLKDDMKHFRNYTKDGVVLMGRKTYESIGKPLKGRFNIVCSRDTSPQSEFTYSADGTVLTFTNNIDSYLENFSLCPLTCLYIIGGTEIYNYVAKNYPVDELSLTVVDDIFNDCDARLGDDFFNMFSYMEEIDCIPGYANDDNTIDFKIITYKK